MRGTNLSDQELLCLLKTDDREAFALLFNRYKSRVYRNCLRLLKSGELAEEVLQESFLRLWLNRHKLKPELSVAAYIFRVAENLVVDTYRKAARDKILQRHICASERSNDSSEELLHEQERLQELQKAIAQLPPRRRKVFELCKLEGKSYEEAGTELGISVATVNDHIVKAFHFLRTVLISPHCVLLLLSCVH